MEPQTAREALFEIRRQAAEVHLDTDVDTFSCAIDKTALEGLAHTHPINFELSDETADRLAEALKLLQRVREEGVTELAAEIAEQLVLPPQIEAMMDRRGFRA